MVTVSGARDLAEIYFMAGVEKVVLGLFGGTFPLRINFRLL